MSPSISTIMILNLNKSLMRRDPSGWANSGRVPIFPTESIEWSSRIMKFLKLNTKKIRSVAMVENSMQMDQFILATSENLLKTAKEN